MADTITLNPVARWRATGYSNGPQGADGVATLAREAAMNMLASTWQPDDSEPMLPVHDYDRPAPNGQAYKAVWGYDAVARTEQSACGAECYTYRIPADAVRGYRRTTDTEPAAGKVYFVQDSNGYTTVADPVAADMADYYERIRVESVALRIAADRYLARGCCVAAVLSDSLAPPQPSLLAAEAGVAYLVGDNQAEFKPNKRSSMSATISAQVGAESRAYLHVCLYLADYFGVRDAWIEGGAMFGESGAVVVFSGDVAPDSAEQAESTGAALDVGVVNFTSITPASAVRNFARVSMWTNIKLGFNTGAYTALTDGSVASRVRNLLATMSMDPSVWWPELTVDGNPNNLARATEVDFSGSGTVGFSSSNEVLCVCMAALCAHGLTRGATYRGLRFGTPLPCDNVPCRVVVYGMSGDWWAAESLQGLRYGTPAPWWADVLSRVCRSGSMTSLRLASAFTRSVLSLNAPADNPVNVTPLAAVRASGQISEIAFARPYISGELSTLFVMLYPDGVPAGDSTESVEEISAVATRDVSLVCPVAATRTEFAAAVSVTGTIHLRITSSVLTALSRAVSGFGVSGGHWNDAVMRMASFVSKSNYSSVAVDILDVAFDYGGRHYTCYYNSRTHEGDVPEFSAPKADFRAWRPSSATGNLSYQYSLSMSGVRLRFAARSDDGATLVVEALGGGGSMTLIGSNGVPDSSFNSMRLDPADWNSYNLSSDYATNFSTGSFQDLVDSASVGTDAYDYAFATAADETVAAALVERGRISFDKNDITYAADYESAGLVSAAIRLKGNWSAWVGADRTAVALLEATVPGFTQRLEFRSEAGSVLWADVSFNSVALAANTPATARAAYLGLPERGPLTSGFAGTATIRESIATAEVSPGLITLIE